MDTKRTSSLSQVSWAGRGILLEIQMCVIVTIVIL